MRLIDADALIEKCGEWYTEEGPEEGYIGPLKYLLNKQPTIEPKQGWIPCSERLPEKGHYYLWCSDRGSVQSDYYWDGFDKEHKYGYNIVAWMPLPKPWKGADDDTD